MRSSLVPLLAPLGVGVLLLLPACSGVPDEVTGSFNFTTDAFVFANFDSAGRSAELNAPLAARLFGDEAVCAKGAGPTCEANAAAQLWIDEVNQTLSFGHSEGMAVLALLMSSGQVAPADFGGENAAALQLDRKLREELAYWASTQKVASAHARDRSFAANDVLPFLAEALKDKTERWRLLIAIREGSGFRAGHAVVPFGYVKGAADDQYFIRIYDPNFPAEERRIEVNPRRNTWRYEGSPNADTPRSYEGTTDNANRLYFSPVSARQGTLVPPFREGFAASIGQGGLLVRSEGVEVGLKDGVVVEQGGLVMPGASDCFCKAPSGITNTFISGSAPQTITFGADAGTVFASSPAVSARVEGTNGAGGVTVDPTAKTVTYNSEGDAGTTITTTTLNADGSQTTVTVRVNKPSNAITIDASDPSAVKVTADVTTEPTTIFVETTVTTPGGLSTTTTAQGTTSGGNDVAVTFDTTTGATSVNNNVNYALCLNGKKDPMEADVDCGDFCTRQAEKNGDGRCLDGKQCTLNNDCRPPYFFPNGECFNGTCAAQSCDDGRQNLLETSIDCGGTCPCGVGKSCASPNVCRVGLTCVPSSMLCQPYLTHELTITGLGGAWRLPIDVSEDGRPAKLLWADPRPGGAAFVFPFGAAESFSVSLNSAAKGYACTFDTADGMGRWTWSGTPGGTQRNTLRCRSLEQRLGYTTNGSGCPGSREVTPAGSSIRVWEEAPEGPTLTFASAHPAVDVDTAQWGPSVRVISTTRSPIVQAVKLNANPYDGGVAWNATLGPAIEAFSLYRYNTSNIVDIAALNMPKRKYRFACDFTGASSGSFATTDAILPLNCSCTELDAGVAMDAGTDAGVDAGMDAGMDAGTDAGVDAGVDAGTVDAGAGAACTFDTDCGTTANCYCGDSSGNCPSNSGRCGLASGTSRFATFTPTTDGVAPSGSFTVPAGCTQLRINAWGAAGGEGEQFTGMTPLQMPGGAGGHVTGVIPVTPGQVFTAWVGRSGSTATQFITDEGMGSYAGTVARGGLGDGMAGGSSGGSGGGLTSLRHAEANMTLVRVVTVPGGGGGGSTQPAAPAGDTGSGDHTTRAGQAAEFGSYSGGGGAGENGGTAGLNGAPGIGGAFGTLPAGLTSSVGSTATPAGTTLGDYTRYCSGAGASSVGSTGHGCIVLRCLP
jgi:hypothetical protein